MLAHLVLAAGSTLTSAECEVDSCQEHVGQGGGQPHWHGDPFGAKCMYSQSNYSSGNAASHPPVIGFAFDGHLIYGRYLSSSAPGYAAPLLDACGGHVHDVESFDEHGFNLKTTYHYHTQMIDATCESGDMCTTGEQYAVSTTGPFQCFKADVTQSEGSSALLSMTTSTTYKTKNQMSHRCCGMTDYYALTGVSLASADVAESSKCTVPAAPANGAYPASGTCASGATMLSGNGCTPTCNTGYKACGQTKCVKGSFTETSTCIPTADTCTPSVASPPPPGASSSSSSSSSSTSNSAPPAPPPAGSAGTISDPNTTSGGASGAIIGGAVGGSVGGLAAIGGLIWYLKAKAASKMTTTAVTSATTFAQSQTAEVKDAADAA